MKKILVFALFIFTSFPQARGSFYSDINLKVQTRKLCQIVDSLEPGSYHFMSCKRHAQDILLKKKDLIRDSYKICSEGMVGEPHRCYTTLSSQFFKPLLKLKKMTFNERILVETFILQHLFGDRADSIRRQGTTAEIRIYLSLQETLDLIQGGQQTIMDGLIFSCARVSDWNMLLNSDANDEWYELQNKCYQFGLDWLERKLIK